MTETLALCMHITKRNWKVYRKSFISNISPTVADPIFFILSLGLGLGSFVPDIGGHRYIDFIAPGLAVSTALMTSFFETSYGFYIRMTFENVFKAMLTTPIGIREVIIGEFIWVALKGALMTVSVSLVLACFGTMEHIYYLPLMGIVGALIGIACGSLGLLAASWVSNINQFQTVYSFGIAPLFFFSGIFFPLDRMPTVLQWIAQALPLAQGVHISQAIFWDEGIGRAFLISGGILILQSAILSTIAYKAVYKRLIQ